MPPTITTQKGYRVRLDFAERTLLNQTNDHLDVQVYLQLRVTRHFLQTRVSRHSQSRSKNSLPQPIKTNHLEIRLISLAVIVFVERELTTSYGRFQLSGAFVSKNETRNDARQIPTIIIHPSIR